ncbi:TPA: hypothetical protein HA243_01920 [Candidatus Micrarchaeota archaeon]|nr:hypothetical protein [Candidatus Micrarchaeota archaeon]
MENNAAKVMFVMLALFAQVFAASSDALNQATVNPKVEVTAYAEPSEVALYSPFLVTGKIAYLADGAYIDSVSNQLKLKVVTTFATGNYLKAAGNKISLAADDEGIIEKVVNIVSGRVQTKKVADEDAAVGQGSDSEKEKRASSVVSVVPSGAQAKKAQERIEYITLGPGESTTVSAYFTADKPGTQFATVSVYKVSGVCPSNWAPCYEDETLLRQSTVKVKVNNQPSDDSAPPLPPEESGSAARTIKVKSGWNMVSVPVNAKISMSDLSNQCGTSPYAWRLSQSGYVKEDTLAPGIGYWVKGTRECSFAVAGSLIEPGEIALFSGWNLVGAFGKEVSIADYAGSCSITGGPWYYGSNSAADSANPYVYSSSLEPGKAYWIKVPSSCKLGKGEQPPPPPSGNQAPVITGVSGPSSLKVGEQGTWSVSAYDPEGKQLSYYVTWGDESSGSGAGQLIAASQTATLTHIYYTAGNFRPTFKVADSQGASATATVSVNVAGNFTVCPSPVIPTCASGFDAYKYKDNAGCDRYGCARVLQQQESAAQ